MYANYNFKTNNKYNELRAIVKEFNKFIKGYEGGEDWTISPKLTMPNLIREFYETVEGLLVEITKEDFPERVMEFFESIEGGRSRSFVKFHPDVYRDLLPEMSGPAAKLYMAFKLFVKHQEPRAGTTYVSRKKLAEVLEVSVRTVEKYVAELKKLGLVKNNAPRGARRNDWEVL